ncbi:E3 ubiquitin-protein ligase TRIM56-like [Mytilus edulis]|uniref:E3 ubiquitin-protein ligase TRIM56-like n=1 Tax=Mytilus edulis TaxID=6550 RepID=UPI0039EF2EFB
MAFKNTVNLITELERRYLECSICTEVFDEDERIPRLLPCHHPFCSECIKRLGRRKDTIKCPTFNAVHKVKKNGPIDFPKDNTRRNLTSFLQTHSDHNAFKKCSQCGNTVDITFKCQQCNINLCEICRCQHETKYKTHNLIINKSETFREEDDNLDVCQNPHHERAKVKYFCNSSNCQSVLCPSCALDEHRDISKHDLEDIEAAFKQRKSELGNDTKSLRTRISHVESTKQTVLDKTNTLQDEKDDFLQNMDAIYNRGIAELENRRQRLIDRYIIAFKRKESKLLTRKHNLDSFLQNASECCSLSEQLINHNSMSSFLSVHQTLDVHVKRCLNIAVEDSSCDTNDSETNIDFNDYLHTFNGNVELLENTKREEGLESLIEPAKAMALSVYIRSMSLTFPMVYFAPLLQFLTHKSVQN